MTLELISQFQQAEPFVPFRMFLADARVVPVTNPELFMIAEDSRSVSVFEPQQATEFFDLALIVSVRFDDSKP
ncbi:MAG: hypothetical protein QOE70_2766 [Chthoniobacter sp.]|jgi:hypothetical protein|nr:hypothetical protein [Chthoniobacter sp.]